MENRQKYPVNYSRSFPQRNCFKYLCCTFPNMLLIFACIGLNLSHSLRTPMLPNSLSDWPMINLRDRMVKIGAKANRHAGSIILPSNDPIWEILA